MMHTRAAASDYDDWEKVHGNPGWGSADLFDLLKKVCLVHQVFVFPVLNYVFA